MFKIVLLSFFFALVRCQSCSNDTLKIQQNGVSRLTIDNTGTVTIPSGSLSLNIGLDGYQLIQNFGQDVDVGQYSSTVVGTDGFPLISFYDAKNKDLKVVHCKNVVCNGSTIFTIDNVGDVGQYTHIALGNDGFGIISYYDVTNRALKVAHCSDTVCSGAVVTTIDTGNVGRFSSITGQQTGNPLITYYSDATQKLKFVACNNALCTSFVIRTITYASTNYGLYSSITYNPADSLAIFAFYDSIGADLIVGKCTDATCSTPTLNLLESTNDVGSWCQIAIFPSDPSPWIAYVQVGAAVRVTRCASAACTSGSTFTADGITTTAQWLSLAGDATGNPIVSYQENVAGGRLRVAHCTTTACLPSGILVYVANNTGANSTSLVMGSDGLPFISYYNSQTQDLFAAHCDNTNCSTSLLINVACCDRNQFAINKGLTQLFAVDDTGAITNNNIASIQTAMSLCNGDGICGPTESLTCNDCKTNCLDIMLAGFSVGDTTYNIINANGTRMRIYCDMNRIGGGWTLISKFYYQSGYGGIGALLSGTDTRGSNLWNGGAFGTIEDGISGSVAIGNGYWLVGNTWYKLSDNDIRNSIVGPTNNFDVMFDQVGAHPTYNPAGNIETVVIRNYTAVYNFSGPTANSSTPIVVTSYRLDTGAVMMNNIQNHPGWTCAFNSGGRGINCGSNTNFVAGNCTGMPPGAPANPGWPPRFHQMNSDSDTYFYGCTGYMASSNQAQGYKAAHRVWIRRRAPGL